MFFCCFFSISQVVKSTRVEACFDGDHTCWCGMAPVFCGNFGAAKLWFPQDSTRSDEGGPFIYQSCESRRRFRSYLAVQSTSLHLENTLAQDQRLQEAQGPKMEGPIFSTMWGTQLFCCDRRMDAIIFDLKKFFVRFSIRNPCWSCCTPRGFRWRITHNTSWPIFWLFLSSSKHKVSCFQLKRAMNKQHPKWWKSTRIPSWWAMGWGCAICCLHWLSWCLHTQRRLEFHLILSSCWLHGWFRCWVYTKHCQVVSSLFHFVGNDCDRSLRYQKKQHSLWSTHHDISRSMDGELTMISWFH